MLDWKTYTQITKQFPIKLIGHNPDIPGIEPAKNVIELRKQYRQHRFYIYTSKYDYEDGFNLSLLEAMSVGMPVISSYHPNSPIINNDNGYISRDIDELRWRISQLLNDLELAKKLGQAARHYICKNHSFKDFKKHWHFLGASGKGKC